MERGQFSLVLIREPFYGIAHFFAHFSNKNQLNSYAYAGKRGRGRGRRGVTSSRRSVYAFCFYADCLICCILRRSRKKCWRCLLNELFTFCCATLRQVCCLSLSFAALDFFVSLSLSLSLPCLRSNALRFLMASLPFFSWSSTLPAFKNSCQSRCLITFNSILFSFLIIAQ